MRKVTYSKLVEPDPFAKSTVTKYGSIEWHAGLSQLVTYHLPILRHIMF